MKAILLTQGQVAFVDDADYDRISARLWYAAKTKGGGYYAQTKSGHGVIQMQRVIIDADASEFVDHRNHDALDNRRCNLRKCTQADNTRNRVTPSNSKRATNQSCYKGVCWHARKNLWQAYIGSAPKEHIGYFASEEQAARAYDERAAQKFGDFSHANFDSTRLPSITQAERKKAISLAEPRRFVHWRERLTPDSANAHTTLFFDHEGKRLTLLQWSKEKGMNMQTLRNRVFSKGWDFVRAISTPIKST